SCFYDSIIVESIISVHIDRRGFCFALRCIDIRWRILPYINLVAYRSWGCCIDQHRNIEVEGTVNRNIIRHRYLEQTLSIPANRRTAVADARYRLACTWQLTEMDSRTAHDNRWSLIGNRYRVRIFASCYRILIIVLSCFYDSIIVESVISVHIDRWGRSLARRVVQVSSSIWAYVQFANEDDMTKEVWPHAQPRVEGHHKA